MDLASYPTWGPWGYIERHLCRSIENSLKAINLGPTEYKDRWSQKAPTNQAICVQKYFVWEVSADTDYSVWVLGHHFKLELHDKMQSK